ncbi:MAG: CoA-binding protein [Chloroflexota bacterium]|nr:CoA-binding protein [Chloroflexota bacterium]
MDSISKGLDRAFNPRSVAVIGDKLALGYMWLKSLSHFQGRLYSVQIDENELPGIEALGVENYLSLRDIPDDIDYAIVAVPNTVTPRIVRDCIDANVGAATLFTSGFAESGSDGGRKLQDTIASIARDGNLNLIGPNCMGIHNPRIGLCHSLDQPHGTSGNVGFISQSGTHATFFTAVGPLNGVRISKSVSYGNAVALDCTDFLEYLGDDEETDIIGMYIEGVNDGRRLFSVLRDVARRKPVLVWKGGVTEEGSRATASHTASMAGAPVIWDTLIRQCGAIKANSLDEMIDTMKVLLYAEPTTGNRVGLAAMTGGQSVVITDAFTREGFDVPLLTERSYDKFAAFFDTLGASYRNPLDISLNFPHLDRIIRSLDILSEDDNIDIVVLEISIAFMKNLSWIDTDLFDEIIDALSGFKERSDKPFIAIVVAAHAEHEAIDVRSKLAARNIPSFSSFNSGAKALKKALSYHRTAACH